MRISDYKTALNELDDKELDQLVLQRSENAIRFEPVLGPPGNWDHAQGAVINAPGQAAEGHHGPAMHDIGDQSLSSRLPVQAAVACMSRNLDPAGPDSLMAEAVETVQSELPFPPFSETCLASIQRAFPDTLRDIQFQSASAQPQLLAEALTIPIDPETQRQSLTETFISTIDRGTLLLPEMLQDYLRLQTLIDASPRFSRRQKTWLHQALDEGTLDEGNIKHYSQAAGWMQSRFLEAIFPRRGGTVAEMMLVEHLNTAANTFVEMAMLIIEAQQKQTPPAPVDNTVFNTLLQELCEKHIAFAVAGMSRQDARTLLAALTLTDSDTLDRLIAKAGPTPRNVLNALKQSLEERTREIDLDLHADMVMHLNRIIGYLVSKDRSRNIDLPGGTAIAMSFWEAIRDSRLSLKRKNGTSFIDRQDWPLLDETTRKQRLALGYQEIVDTLFDGDKNQALAFFRNITNLIPAISWLIGSAPNLTPIHLPDGTPVRNLRGDIQDDLVLTHTENGLLQFMYVRQVTAPRVAFDYQKASYWLDAKNSDCHYELDCALTPTAHIVLLKPMRLTYKTRLSDWPKKGYPEPVPDDFGPGYSFHHDLFAYAGLSGNPEHIHVLSALDALHQFQQAPSFDSAFSIHAQFIASGALACLGDVTALPLPGLIEMLKSVNIEPLIETLANITAQLGNTPDEQLAADNHDALIALKETMATLSTHPTTTNLRLLQSEWYLRSGRFTRFLQQIPETLERELSNSLGQALRQTQKLGDHPEPMMFKPLEDEIVHYITREILPGFIESVRQDAAEDPANAGS